MDKLEQLELLIGFEKRKAAREIENNRRKGNKDKVKELIGMHTAFSACLTQVELLLYSESQGDISASTGESDILHPVVERDVIRLSPAAINGGDVNRALKNIIDCESFLCKATDWKYDSCLNQCIHCKIRAKAKQS